MSKAATDRFDEALKTLEDFCVQFQRPGMYYMVLGWLQAQPNVATAKATVGALLSLDTHGPSSGDRKLARAFLLVSATLGKKSAHEVGLLRKELLALHPLSFGTTIRTKLTTAMSQHPRKLGPVIDETLLDKITALGFAKANILDGFDVARTILGKAKQKLEAKQCNDVYERWFGAMNAGRYAQVTENISNIFLASQTKTVVIKFVDRNDYGSAELQDFGRFKTKELASIGLGNKFFGPSAGRQPRTAVYDLAPYGQAVTAIMELNRNKKAARLAVQQRAIAFDDVAEQNRVTEEGFAAIETNIESRVAALARDFGDNAILTYGGIITHELSHNIVGTKDVATDGITMYGYNLCRYLAVNDPAKAITNADSYRMFCEAFLPA